MSALAEPDMAWSSTEVAVIVTVGAMGTWEGAEYRPDDEIVPHAAPAQPGPETDQFTRLSSAFRTVAVNFRSRPMEMVGSGGVTVTMTAGKMATETVNDLDGSATAVAVTSARGGLGTAAGAV
jgi:hypothetical protein